MNKAADVFTKKPNVLTILETLRTGPGAFRLPSNIKFVTLRSTAGTNKFTNQVMPRIAFNNPQVEFDIDSAESASWIVGSADGKQAEVKVMEKDDNSLISALGEACKKVAAQ